MQTDLMGLVRMGATLCSSGEGSVPALPPQALLSLLACPSTLSGCQSPGISAPILLRKGSFLKLTVLSSSKSTDVTHQISQLPEISFHPDLIMDSQLLLQKLVESHFCL